jgi:hypothetical protein
MFFKLHGKRTWGRRLLRRDWGKQLISLSIFLFFSTKILLSSLQSYFWRFIFAEIARNEEVSSSKHILPLSLTQEEKHPHTG